MVIVRIILVPLKKMSVSPCPLVMVIVRIIFMEVSKKCQFHLALWSGVGGRILFIDCQDDFGGVLKKNITFTLPSGQA